jgi:hypothetical protein
MTPIPAMMAAVKADLFLKPHWRKRVLIAALVWFLMCLFYGAPATLFAALLRSIAPQLQLQNVSGSFWNGNAAEVFWLQNGGQQNNQTIALGSIEWHLQPWSLLWLHPSAHITANYGEQFVDATIRLSPLGAVTLNKTSAALPATLLSNWLPIPARGQIALKLDRAELSRTQLRTMQGVLYWQQAQWQWNAHWLALGDYRCELTMPAAQKVHCGVQGQGALALDGAIDVSISERSWLMQLQVKAAPSLPDDFRQSLQLMLAGEPDAQGNVMVKRNGRW